MGMFDIPLLLPVIRSVSPSISFLISSKSVNFLPLQCRNSPNSAWPLINWRMRGRRVTMPEPRGRKSLWESRMKWNVEAHISEGVKDELKGEIGSSNQGRWLYNTGRGKRTFSTHFPLHIFPLAFHMEKFLNFFKWLTLEEINYAWIRLLEESCMNSLFLKGVSPEHDKSQKTLQSKTPICAFVWFLGEKLEWKWVERLHEMSRSTLEGL